MKKWASIIAHVACLLQACDRETSHAYLMNEKARLPVSFNFDSLKLKVMASFINAKLGTISLLYANSPVIKNSYKVKRSHSAGEVMALITWKQQPDTNWFGARIPGALQTLELIEIIADPSHPIITYKRYRGRNLLIDKDTLGQLTRTKYILELQPSVMP